MKSLIMKDLYNISHNMKQMVLVMIFVGICIIPTNGASAYVTTASVLGCMMTMTTFAFDEQCGWMKYALVMPLSRNEYVMSKYIINIIFTGIGIIMGLIISGVASLILGNFNLLELLMYALTGLLISCFFSGLYMPALIKYGAEKARFIMIGVIAALAAIIALGVLISETINLQFTKSVVIVGSVIGIVLMAMLMISSYFVSCRIMRKKEF